MQSLYFQKVSCQQFGQRQGTNVGHDAPIEGIGSRIPTAELSFGLGYHQIRLATIPRGNRGRRDDIRATSYVIYVHS